MTFTALGCRGGSSALRCCNGRVSTRVYNRIILSAPAPFPSTPTVLYRAFHLAYGRSQNYDQKPSSDLRGSPRCGQSTPQTFNGSAPAGPVLPLLSTSRAMHQSRSLQTSILGKPKLSSWLQARSLAYTSSRSMPRDNEEKSPQSTTSLEAEPSEEKQQQKGIRRVIPKVLPSLSTHENIYTIPNLLTFSRLIAAPVIGYAILHDYHAMALGLFVYAGVTDLLDGWIARRWNLQTVVGSVVDPMADKMLMTVLVVCLAAKGALPLWVASLILGRDVGLAISAIYYRWISLPPPKTFSRYWDFSLPSAEVRPTTISKYNTFLQLALMGATTVAPLVSILEMAPFLTGLQYIVATTTVWSGLSYVFSKDAVKILSQKDQPADKKGDGKPNKP